MGSVLRSFGAFQGNIWSVAPFIPVEPCENQWKNTKKNDVSKNARAIFLFFSHNPSILGIKEIPSFSRSVTDTLGWIWSGRGVMWNWYYANPRGAKLRKSGKLEKSRKSHYFLKNSCNCCRFFFFTYFEIWFWMKK